jgi:iron(III) transport system substrate-binding protein
LAGAASAFASPLPTWATVSGPVDDAALIAAAKREGGVTLYGSMSQLQMTMVANRFEAEYGIPVQTLRGDNGPIIARFMTELRAGQPRADVIDLPGFNTREFLRQGVLDRFRPPEAAFLMPGTVDPDGYWVSAFFNTEVIAYNPKVVKTLGLTPPSGWEDFARPEWRGHVAMYQNAFEWFGTLSKYFGKEKAEQLLRGYAANQPRLVASKSLAVNMLASGEVAGVAVAYAYDVNNARKSGAAIEFVNPNPVVVELHCIAVSKTAPHPNAARLLERWWLSHTTQVWLRDGLGRISGRRDVKTDPRLFDPKAHYVVSEPADADHAADVMKTYNEIYNIPA